MLTKPRKTAVVVARCTASEREAIIARAQRANKSVSEYLIGCAMHFADKPVDLKPAPNVSRFLSSADGRSGA